MATVNKTKKYQAGGAAEAILKAKAAKDTTTRYTKEDQLDRINKITRGELSPFKDKASATGQGSKKYATVNKGDTTYMSKGAFEKKYAPKQKSGGKLAKKVVKKIVKSTKKK